jgi:hypothetical protein
MADDNPFKSPESFDEPPRVHAHLFWRVFSPPVVFFLALIAAILMGVGTIGGVFVASNHEWAAVPTLLILFYAAASVWCGRIALKILRREL